MWTPKRVVLLVGSFALFFTAYQVYGRLLGGIDGLPPLPQTYWRATNVGPIKPPPPSFVDRKLCLAFGDECDELACPIKLEVPSKGIVLASNDFIIKDGGVRLSPISVALFNKKTPSGKFPEITTIRGAAAVLTFDRPVSSLADMDKRKITGCDLIGAVEPEGDPDRRKTGNGIVVVHNRGTAGRDDDIHVYVQRGPVFYRETPPRGNGQKRMPEIWTDDAVEMTDLMTRPQPSTVKATGLDIFLVNEPQTARPGPAPARKPRPEAVSGVERVVLRSGVQMHLFVDSKSGFLAPAKKPAAAPAEAAADKPAAKPVEKCQLVITTHGPFVYDMVKDLATFDIPPNAGSRFPEHVLVNRYQELDKPDQLICEHLELQFRRKPTGPNGLLTPSPVAPPEKGGSPGPAADADKERERSTNLEIETAHATGKQVILTSDAAVLEAHGNDFFYNALTRRTTLKGDPEMWALKEGNEIHARELQIIDQEGAQQATALGPGRIDLLDKQTGKRPLHARWRDKLETARDGKHDLLTLTGDAAFVDETQGQELRAEVLKVWMEPDERDRPPHPQPLSPGGERGETTTPLSPPGERGKTTTPLSPPGERGKTTTPLSPPEQRGEPTTPLSPGGRGVGGEGAMAGEAPPPKQGGSRRPHHVEAVGRVTARSREMNVQDTDRLVLWFKDSPAPIPVPPVVGQPPGHSVSKPADAEAPPAAGPRPVPSVPVPGSPPTVPAGTPIPPASTPGKPADKPAPADKPNRPIDLSARFVEAHVVRTGDKNELDRLWCEGTVRVRQEGASAADRGVDIKGDTLQLTRTPDGNILVVTGDLAQLRLDKLFILGPEVNIDQAANKAWVNGVGAMQMESSTSFQGAKLKEPALLTIHWNKSMFFDGQFAQYHGGIQAEQQNARLACQSLQVRLDRLVSLKEGDKRGGGPKEKDKPKEAQPPAKVDHMVCDQSVRIEDLVVQADGSPLKYQLLEAPTVAVDNTEGTVRAPGPGVVRIVQPGAADGPGLPGAGKPPAGRGAPAAKPADPGLKLTRVRYDGSMYANNKSHTATFRGNVEAVYVPVQSFDDRFLEPNLDKLPEGGMYIRSDQLTVYSRPEAEGGGQEMEARGKVLVRANEFYASADVLHHHESKDKDQVILEGGAGGLVSLFRRKAPGAPWEEMRAQKVIYSRKTGHFEFIGGRGMQGGN